jgi:hypothetical protein
MGIGEAFWFVQLLEREEAMTGKRTGGDLFHAPKPEGDPCTGDGFSGIGIEGGV